MLFLENSILKFLTIFPYSAIYSENLCVRLMPHLVMGGHKWEYVYVSPSGRRRRFSGPARPAFPPPGGRCWPPSWFSGGRWGESEESEEEG